MKKSLSIFTVFVLCLGLMGCNQQVTEGQQKLSIAALNGPTGMGSVQLMDQTEEYTVNLYQSPDEIVGKVINQEVDIASVPSNMAALLYNKTKGTDAAIELLGVNTLGVLYIVENGQTIQSIQDLKGKTILVGGKGTAPEFILNEVLNKSGLDATKDVEIKYLANHADIASQLVANEGAVALLPQPFVTTVLAKNEKVKVVIDINEQWEQLTGLELPMGTVIISKKVLEENQGGVEAFVEDYQASIDFVNNQVEEAAQLIAIHKIIPDEKLAQMAIPKCNIVWMQGEEAKECLEAFYEVLHQQEPKSIGGQLPDEVFYNLD